MNSLLRLIALEVKLNRFQLVSVIIGCLLVGLASLYFIDQFRAIGLPAGCTSVYAYPPGLVCAEAGIYSWVRVTQAAETIPPLVSFLPWLAGLLIGVPAVSMEIEAGTSMLSWTLGSRRRWLVRRIVVLLVLLLVAVSVPAVATIALQGTQKPLIDPLQSFDQWGTRGILVVVRAWLAFQIGLVAGLVLGRLLPALITGAAACLLALVLLGAAFPYLMEAQELVPTVTLAGRAPDRGTPALVRRGYRLPDGRFVWTWEEVVESAPAPRGTAEYDEYETLLVNIGYGYPPETAPEASIRESAVTAIISVALLASALVVVRRRRPY